jgi:hypothetical protein
VTQFYRKIKEGSEDIVIMIVNRKHTGRDKNYKRLKKRKIIIWISERTDLYLNAFKFPDLYKN